jgi:hypothetical protein
VCAKLVPLNLNDQKAAQNEILADMLEELESQPYLLIWVT